MKNLIKKIACSICRWATPEGEIPVYHPTVDIPSPRDLVSQEEEIWEDYSGLVNLLLDRYAPLWITTVADTNSMDATVDAGHTCILGGTFNREELAVGDVVVYEAQGLTILHRIIKIEEDELGRLYTLKGDNNYYADRWKIRDFHIKWLLLAIVY